MNIKKTKVMFNNYMLVHEIWIEDEVMECIQGYIYLGQNWCESRSWTKQIKRKLGMGWSDFCKVMSH